MILPTEAEFRKGVQREQFFLRQKQLRERAAKKIRIGQLRDEIAQLQEEIKKPLIKIPRDKEAWERRIEQLREWAKERGWQVVEAKE